MIGGTGLLARAAQKLSRTMQIVACAALAIAPLGCTSTALRSTLHAGGSATCQGSAYYLPKRLLSVAVTKGVLNVRLGNADQIGSSTAVADTRYGGFCLEHAGSPFSADKVTVTVDAETSLLKEVVFNGDDKSSEVAIELVNAIGDFAAFSMTRSIETANASTPDIGPILVDPFDSDRMREVMDTLSSVGVCFFLDGRNDPYIPAWHSTLCEGAGGAYPPVVNEQVAGLQLFDAAADLKAYQGDGILYRPLLSHRLVVMQHQGNRWAEAEWRTIEMPNAAPAFLLHVGRSLIGDSRAEIKFDQGVPVSVGLSKQSEANVFIDIPVSILQVAVSIPVRALTFRRTQIENQKTLIQLNVLQIDTLEKFERARDADVLRGLGIVPLEDATRSTTEATTLARIEECTQTTPDLIGPELDAHCFSVATKGL